MIAPTNRRQLDRVAIRNVLEVRRRHLAEELRLRAARIREQGEDVPHAQNPDDEDATAFDVAMVEIATQTLQRVEAAIERLDHGQYGRCVRCQRRIAEARLRALPFAVRCRKCEALRERAAALRRSSQRNRFWEAYDGVPAGHESL